MHKVRLLRRYQRFLADMQFPDGSCHTVHCPNTGAMLGCNQAGSLAWVSRVNKPTRKYPWTWELVQTEKGPLVGIHTGRSNHLVQEAILTGVLEELQGYARLQAEVMAAPGYRADFRCRDDCEGQRGGSAVTSEYRDLMHAAGKCGGGVKYQSFCSEVPAADDSAI